jgi:hypothetical protein
MTRELLQAARDALSQLVALHEHLGGPDEQPYYEVDEARAVLAQLDAALAAEAEPQQSPALSATLGRLPLGAIDRNAAHVLAALEEAEEPPPVVLALHFHEAYERLAPQFGYETRAETRKFDPTSNNGRLMIAVASELLARIAPPQTAYAETGASQDGNAMDAARYRWLRAGDYSIRLARSILNDTPEGIDAAVDSAISASTAKGEDVSLPNDYARCTGTTHDACSNCLRRQFWPKPSDRALWMVAPPIDMLSGYCEMQIAPHATLSNNTAGEQT